MTVIAPPEGIAWQRLRSHGWFELETELFFAAMLRPGDFVVDVGANDGVLTVIAGLLVGGEGKVVAFEPSSSNRHLLERAVVANKLEDVVLIDGRAVGEQTGEMLFADAGGYALASTDGVPVPCVSLDDFCSSLPPPRLLKVDVDGPELEVLRGALQIVELHRPLLVVELSTEGERLGHTAAELLDFIIDAGYSLYASRMKFARVRPVATLGDLLALPVDLQRGDVANLFCTPQPLAESRLASIWPARFVPPAYFKHYLSDAPFATPSDFWTAYTSELRIAAGDRRR